MADCAKCPCPTMATRTGPSCLLLERLLLSVIMVVLALFVLARRNPSGTLARAVGGVGRLHSACHPARLAHRASETRRGYRTLPVRATPLPAVPSGIPKQPC